MSLRERLAATYADAHALNSETLQRSALPRPGSTLLDLGCGDGALTAAVAARVGARRILGVELAPEAIIQARANGVEVVEADLDSSLPFEDASFDVIHSNQVIEHLSDTDTFLAEIRRLLRPDGYALVSTNNLASWHNIVSLMIGWQPPPCQVSDWVNVGNPMNYMEGYNGGRVRQHRRLFTTRALRELAEFHGLRAELAVVVGFYPLPRRLAQLAARVDRTHGAYLIQRYRPI